MNATAILLGALRRSIPADHEITLTGDELTQLALDSFKGAFDLVLGPGLGGAVFADLMGEADRPNSEMAPGVSRQVTSKWCNRVRRNAGMPIRCPAKGVGRGRKPKDAGLT